jgi:hypothetical protein
VRRAFFGGTTRQWLFDNPKIVVLERHGDAARFHPLLLDLGQRHARPIAPVRPYRGNEKGRVERKIRFLRDRFLAGRDIHSIEQGNRELLAFIDTIAHQQHHPNFPNAPSPTAWSRKSSDCFRCPIPMPATDLVSRWLIDKTAFARFDTNLYSVPPDHVERTLTLVADDRTSDSRRRQPWSPSIPALWGQRQKDRVSRTSRRDHSAQKRAAPSTGATVCAPPLPTSMSLSSAGSRPAATSGSMTAQTTKLLDLYGHDVFAKGHRRNHRAWYA